MSNLLHLDFAWLSHPAFRWPLTAAYVIVLLLVSVYGIHRYWLVYLYYRHRRNVPRPMERFKDLPIVTVQLPMFNESTVAERIIDAACALTYPADKLQIQVLDDSTDDSQEIAKARVAYWAAKGVDILYIHRTDRTGYKAGALANATPFAKGNLIAIFDADFLPNPSFLKRTVHYFTDPKIGMVQARWDHLNRNDSLLTQSQAIFLDSHFIIQQTARNRADCWFNFNGTAGIWRREAIQGAGGWHHDTLTEDVDLSYRAQLAGWNFVFLPRVACPAELPPEMNAFKSQQHRWTKGSIQTAIKLLPTLLRAKIPLKLKLEAFFHLTSPMVYLYVTLMVLLFYPAFFVNMQPFERGSAGSWIWGLTMFTLGTASAGAFYLAGQAALHRSVWRTVLHLPLLMGIGVGIALNNARGCIEALLRQDSPFVRTPKYNSVTGKTSSGEVQTPAQKTKRSLRQIIPSPSIKMWMTMIEIGFAMYMLECISLAMQGEHALVSVPFLVLFAVGYFYVGLSSLWSHISVWRESHARSALA